ncbi:MAG: hypothetical protein ACI9XP_000706 [Lentimonas sp.]|jgi:hypothetical protein
MKLVTLLSAIAIGFATQAQLSPAITSWLQNDTETGTYYTSGNSTPIANNILVNCQKVEYSADFVYVSSTGVPSYPTGPFLDGNPSNATNQDAIFKIPLDPQPNTGTLQESNPGNIGVFINGVALFDYRDGVAWNPSTGELCGGPGNTQCPGGPGAVNAWNRDAIPAERGGFDCAKGHPAMGNYHHHQNPSAFKLDLQVVSDICNLYDAEGLYAIDSLAHSPLIGYAYDGFPIYGAYGFANANGTGGVTRIMSGYALRNNVQRTHHADGTDVADGPDVDATYFDGYFREDYEFIASTDEDVLDKHNGRFSVTPEYPNGIYCYFATVDENWNSAYPYVVGPTFYGNATNRKVTSVDETTTEYSYLALAEDNLNEMNITVFPNPASELVAVQINSLLKSNTKIALVDATGKVVQEKIISAGSTIAYFDIQTVYDGVYFVKISNGVSQHTTKVLVLR